jgi:DNA repair protein RadC
MDLSKKITHKGRKHLSNCEMLSLIVGTGNNKDLAVATSLLKKANNDLNKLARYTAQELCTVNGVTEKKASYILASLELGIRRESTPISSKPQISQSSDAYNVLKADLKDLNHEEFYILVLNQANRVIEKHKISQGGVAGTIVDIKKIMRLALSNSLTAALILGHNHPSDNLRPSKADIDITKKIKEAGKVLDIAVLDHIIVAGDSYTSLADEGYM